ncbi:MAG: hypothetical protein JWQ81_3307 [Amycolatopsis sp.]|uniref:PaaI family thioesterase n=1 Tax=Amycolatopsis sp. TaxID=37632 RepID=UPI002623AAFC|nr:DUF4442 domain-containing protein [Amycolatopsis sp.]MCU1682568.1 hypothetical protein [Amycolatopsis sp.]
MDLTALARRLLESIPAHQLIGLRVLRAQDGSAEVAVDPLPQLHNVIGTLHSSGLTALVDAAGLAALIAAAADEQQFDGIVPLGASAELRFLAPASGRLVARCTLDHTNLAMAQALFTGVTDKIRLKTDCEISDAHGTVVCTGSFRWSVRRMTTASACRT